MKQQSTTNRKIVRFVDVFFMFLLWVTASAEGGELPHKTIQQMCFTSDLIIDGAHVGNGKVHVNHIFYRSMPTIVIPKTIYVSLIPKHSRIIDEIFMRGKNVPPITTNRLVLFLINPKGGMFQPIDVIGNGSQGLFWYDDKACYGYGQVINPGPYCLMASKPGGYGRIPKDKNAMWKEIKIGLEQRSRWEAVEMIKNPNERARQMATYLLPDTAPEGYAQSVDLRRAIRKIGPAAVPALVEVIEKAKPEDGLNTTVLTLFDIGCTHPDALRPAVPALCKLLSNPGSNSLYYILSPLKAARNQRAIPYVRPMLKHKDKQVRGQAARALAAMKDQKSFDEIVILVEKPKNPDDRLYYTLELARSLFELDPKRARPIIKQVECVPGNAGLHYFIAGFN